ncbi:MAG: C39 family peptidase [Candidatus Melainabacteria bacterium]|nr:C39 family peptidase [Candidatus Melainabacteria bacterium]
MKLLSLPAKIFTYAFLGTGILTAAEPNTKRLSMPDFCQADTRYGEFPKDGKHHYCAPTAVSNILVYLDTNGFPNMLAPDVPNNYDQFKLIKLLGSDKYMKSAHGTKTSNLMSGLEKYVKERGYKISIQYKNLKHVGKYLVIDKTLKPSWIKNKLDENYECVLGVNFYSRKKKERIGGHYVTVVDFQDNDPLKILVHDPSSRSGIEPKTELWQFIPTKKGLWQIKMSNDKKNRIVILNDVIAFKVRKK